MVWLSTAELICGAPWQVVFESPVVWTEKKLKLNQVGPFATRLSVAVAEGLGKWWLQSAPELENS